MKEKLLDLIKNSYAPYSNMHFACIVETKSGNFYEGVNIENASFGGCICAERNAINSAVSHGERKLEFFDKNVLFNIMNTKGEMKVLTFEEVLNTHFVKEDLK